MPVGPLQSDAQLPHTCQKLLVRNLKNRLAYGPWGVSDLVPQFLIACLFKSSLSLRIGRRPEATDPMNAPGGERLAGL